MTAKKQPIHDSIKRDMALENGELSGFTIPTIMMTETVKQAKRKLPLISSKEAAITVNKTDRPRLNTVKPKKYATTKETTAPNKEPITLLPAADSDSSINVCSTMIPDIAHHKPAILGIEK